MRIPPGNALSHHRVEDRKQLPHARHQSYLLGLAGPHEALVELLDGRIETRGDQGSHVERFADPGSSAPNGASTPQSAGVAVQRSDTDKGRELPGRNGAKLRQLCQKRPAQDRTHPRNAPQESLVRLEGRALFDGLIEAPVGAGELFFEPPYVGLDASADGFGGARSEAVFLGGHHPNDLPPTGEDLLKLPGFLVGDGSRGGTDGLGEVSKDESIQSVGLGELARGLGEISGQARIDHKEGNLRGGQGRCDGALEASTGLQNHQSLPGEFRQELAEELIDARLVVSNDEVYAGREDGDVQGGLGDIYPYVASCTGAQGGSPFFPAPNLAGTGSGRSPAQATVRAPPEALEGRGDPGFLAVSVLGPR